MMGREGTGWPRSSIMGSVCFAKIALMLSEPLKGKRTQKTMQICMRLVHTCANGVTKRPRAGIKVSTCELEVVNICANFQIHWDGQEI